ncbi:hypothetical protein EI427_07395 [Flammeovirga pectinis]|uniref:Uncharacterized protein n=1 Tax=Flammeovirga pectinis TaxID=2494373 RepID=A0A3S9P1N5_9BACT|nr:hypothetical protein [Flammeovirga pectinis]AZQ62070.1 hypothetical protein EI427_07395 [Flammeovirga pectinis]
MLDLFKNKLLNYKLNKVDKSNNIIHNNKLPLKDSSSVGLLLYIKDAERLQSILNEMRIIDKILPKNVKNIDIIFISETSKNQFDIPFNCKVIPLSKIDWNKNDIQSDIQRFINNKFDYLFTFSFNISKILDRFAQQSYATCRVALGEHQDVESYEMKLMYDQISFTERIRAAVEILNRM